MSNKRSRPKTNVSLDLGLLLVDLSIYLGLANKIVGVLIFTKCIKIKINNRLMSIE